MYKFIKKDETARFKSTACIMGFLAGFVLISPGNYRRITKIDFLSAPSKIAHQGNIHPLRIYNCFNNFYILLLFMVVICSVISCTSGQGNKNGRNNIVNDDDFEENNQLRQIFRENLTDCFEEYNTLVRAFNTRNHLQIDSQATAFLQSISDLDITNLRQEDMLIWNKDYEIMVFCIEEILGTDDLKEMEINLNDLSSSFYSMIKTFGLQDRTVYLNVSPEALEGNGGKWLSPTSDTNNPYADNDSAYSKKVENVLNYK